MVDIKRVSALVDFEVIETVNDSNSYPVLLVIHWASDMNRVTNLNKCKMIFEKKSLRVVVRLDLAEGVRYTEPVHGDNSDDDLDCIYKITAREQDLVNPTANGRISWARESYCTSNLDEEIERWQNQLYEIKALNCNMMIRSLRCVIMKIRDLPRYDGLAAVDDLLNKFESKVPKQ